MNVAAFFLGLAGLLLALSLYALWRSLRVSFGVPAELTSASAVGADRAALVDEKNALLRSLKDLDYEKEVGKIAEEDYERLQIRYRRRAKEILRLLDQDLAPYLKEADALIKARLNETQPDQTQAGSAAPKKKKKAEKKKKRKKKAAVAEPRRCPSCETQNDADARFCKSCAYDFEPKEEAADA